MCTQKSSIAYKNCYKNGGKVFIFSALQKDTNPRELRKSALDVYKRKSRLAA